jgi:hypothetical protein
MGPVSLVYGRFDEDIVRRKAGAPAKDSRVMHRPFSWESGHTSLGVGTGHQYANFDVFEEEDVIEKR